MTENSNNSQEESRSTVCQRAVRESRRLASRLDQPVYPGGTAVARWRSPGAEIESFLRAIDASDFDNCLRQLEEAQAASRPDPYGYMAR